MKRGILYTFLAQAPALFLYFLASTLMTRMLGDVGRGEYTLITNHVALLNLVLGMNIGFGIIVFISKPSSDHAAVIGTATTLLLFNIVAVPFILFAIDRSFLREAMMPDQRLHWTYWAFIYISVIAGFINSSVSAILLGLKKFGVLNWMSVLNAGLSALGFLTIFLIRDEAILVDAFPAVIGVSSIAMVIISLAWCLLYALHVRIPPVPVWKWSVISPILSFSLVGHLSNLINLINYRFDVWVVDRYQGAAELGLYAVAVGLGQLLFNVPEPFSRVVQPYLFGQVKNEMLHRFKAVARLNFTALSVLAVGLALIAHWIVPLLFGPAFQPSVIPLQLLLPGIVLSGATKLLSQLVTHGGLQRYNLIATASAALLTIILDLVLIPRWGMHGAAIATTCSYSLVLLIILYVIRWRMNIPIQDLFLLRPSDIAALKRHLPWPSR